MALARTETIKQLHQLKLSGYLAPEDYSRQYVEIDLSQGNQSAAKVLAIAVQGDPAARSTYVARYALSYTADGRVWQFYHPEKPSSSLHEAYILTGNQRGKKTTKQYLPTVISSARQIRLHPVCWSGNMFALRLEVYTCMTHFDWSKIQTFFREHIVPPKQSNCNKILQVASTSFGEWSLGKEGSGMIFETEEKVIDVKQSDTSSTPVLFKAYTKMMLKPEGRLVKRLLCFQKHEEGNSFSLGDNSECCVSKNTDNNPGWHWPTQEQETAML